MPDMPNWRSFWDLFSPEEAARVLIVFHGSNAALAAAHCGLSAHGDGRNEDYRFWVAVFYKLRMGRRVPVAASA